MPVKSRVFVFSSCQYDPQSGVAKLGFRFDQQMEFYEIIQFQPVKKLDNDRARAFDNALQILHLIAGISYYKARVPFLLKVETLADDPELSVFLEQLYKQGLAEFAYRNQLDLNTRLQFEFSGVKKLSAQKISPAVNHVLLAMGGGKDSLVAAEMLKSIHRPFTTVAIGNSDLIENTAALTGHEFIRIGRKLAPELARMNANGAFNGHVPVTAINAAILVCQALLSSYGEVIFANEASASSPNIYNDKGQAVNHQYSKSWEYEQSFQKILQQKVADQPACFSILRPWRELAVVEKFSHYPQYFSDFSSCNRNFHLQGSRIAGRWCSDCPKCRFACLMLSLWLPREQVEEIIGQDMLADAGQINGFAQLCGFQGHKPFECVGEVEESCVAVLQLAKKNTYTDSPVIAALMEYVAPIETQLPTLEQMLKPLSENNLPPAYQTLTAAMAD